MSTTKSFSYYKGIKAIIKARAKGYWDYKAATVFDTAGESQSITMSAYNGLNCAISDSADGIKILDFSNTVLPYKWDYSTSLSTSKYCLKPSGQSYDIAYYKYSNFIVYGSPTINYDTGIVGGFDTSNYLRTPDSFNPASSPWLIKFKFTTGSTVTNNTIIGSAYTNNKENILLRINSNSKMWFLVSSPSSTWDIIGTSTQGSYTFLTNTTYYCEALYDGTNYIFRYSLDGQNYIEDIRVTSSATIVAGKLEFGAHTHGGGTSEIFMGTIDFSQTSVSIDNAIWWDAKSEYTYDNFTKTGSPTISVEGLVSGFSRYKYISLPKVFNPSSATWEQQIKFTTGNSLSYSYQRLTGTPSDMQGGANIVIMGSRLQIWLTSNNSSWDICVGDYPEGYSDEILQTNTTYWVKLIFDGSKYVLSYSTNGTSFTDIITVTSSTPVASTQAMSFGAGSNNNPFYGTIDLSETYINVGGSLWWKAGGRNIESLAGVLYDYTDDGSAVTLDCYANGDTSVILTDDASYNGTYLGTVNIPAHSV